MNERPGVLRDNRDQPDWMAGYVRSVRTGANVLRQRLRLIPAWVIDAAVGTLVVVGGVLTTAGDADATFKERDAIAWLLILVSTFPYYARRHAPLAVFLLTTTAVTVLMLLDYEPGALPFVLLVGAYTVGVLRPARSIILAAAVVGGLLVVLYFSDVAEFGAGELISSAAAYGASMVLGWTMQIRGEHIAALEYGQAEAALRAAADERLRIAQELHDIVGHSLGVIAVQAGLGMHVIDSDPAEARQTLENISRTSRSSLAEIRRVLGVIRSDPGAPTYTPAPGLDSLPQLAEQVTNAGLLVEVKVAGNLDDLPPGVGLAAYRIVQEALTNTLRHAGAQHVLVHLDHMAGTLLIEVTDDGRGPNAGAAGGGHGLVGMRERVAVYGGSLETGRGPNGGFRVSARLRYDDEGRVT
jgi:signal transduction histidine kinase